MVKPRVVSLPFKSKASDAGDEAVALAKEAGLKLDEWQAYVLRQSMVRRRNGTWAYFEVGVSVARQNGKDGILEGRELAGLFVLEESLQIHSTHQFDTSLEHFGRLLWLVEETSDLNAKVKRVARSHGEEGIQLKTGPRIRFRTRTKGGGRGFSCDCLYLNEAMVISEPMHGALLPTLSARPSPQVWYTGSAVDQLVLEQGVVFSRIRERGMAGEKSLAWFDWSVEGDDPSMVPPRIAADKAAWAQANPALGIRISAEHVANEQRSMDPRTFAVERLGVGDWPRTDHISTVIDLDAWLELEDVTSKVLDPVVLAFDVSPERFSSVGAAGRRSDGLLHVECLASRRGTDWLPKYLKERVKRNKPAALVCDGYGPAASMMAKLEDEGLIVQTFDSGEYGKACGQFVDAVNEAALRYPTSDDLTGAIMAARTRPLGDSVAWSRKASSANISPLVSVTLALSVAMTTKPRKASFAWA